MTLDNLVRVFRESGISLEVNVRFCEGPKIPESPSMATNLGPTGLDGREDVVDKEGTVLCDVAENSIYGNDVHRIKYPTDNETYARVLNVECAVYPSDLTSAPEQVGRVARALANLKTSA